MVGSNLQTYQHSRWGLKWIRNSSSCVSESSGPGDSPSVKKNIIRQACCKHTTLIYCHLLSVCVCFLAMDVGERCSKDRGRMYKCMCMTVSLVVASLSVARVHFPVFVVDFEFLVNVFLFFSQDETKYREVDKIKETRSFL